MMTMASRADSIILELVCWAGLVGSWTMPMMVRAVMKSKKDRSVT